MERVIDIKDSFDLGSTVRMLKAGVSDGSGSWWWATHTIDGSGTIHVERTASGVKVRGWGSGAALLLERAPTIIGADDVSELDPVEPNVRDLLKRRAGTKLGATGAVFETTTKAILGQLVTTTEANRSTRRLVERYGEQAPGPNTAMRLFPAPETIAGLRYEDLHHLGIERKRSATIIEAARRAKRLEEIMGMQPDPARKRLQAVRGIGPWTAEFVMGSAYGDKDAVTPGDYHLPNMISFALAGEPRGDDGRMFELLEPYRPERRRIVVALKIEGAQAPRYGPKTALRDHL